MSNAKVPRVDISESVTQLATPQVNATVLGLIGRSNLATVNGVTTTANKVYRVTSVAQAHAYFGSNTANGRDLIKLIEAAFNEGASEIKAVSIGTPTLGNYSLVASGVSAGATTIPVTNGEGSSFSEDDVIYIGTGQRYKYEEKRTVSSVDGDVLTVSEALQFAHQANEKVQVVTEPVSTDYTNAIAAMQADDDVVMCAIETNDDTTAAAMKTMCDNATANNDAPRVYLRGFNSDVAEADAKTKAQAHNDDRVVCLWPALKNYDGKTVTGGEVAAAVAGAIAGNGIPKLNHNFTELNGFGGVYSTISDYDGLIDAGVTPIELKYSSIHLVRFITTWTTQNDITDTTWQEAAVRLNVDYIERTIKRRLRTKFLQKGNTPTTREAIKQEVISALKEFVAKEIIVANDTYNVPAYKEPVVQTATDDTTAVEVDVEIAPGKPLNFIRLNFKLYL